MRRGIDVDRGGIRRGHRGRDVVLRAVTIVYNGGLAADAVILAICLPISLMAVAATVNGYPLLGESASLAAAIVLTLAIAGANIALLGSRLRELWVAIRRRRNGRRSVRRRIRRDGRVTHLL